MFNVGFALYSLQLLTGDTFSKLVWYRKRFIEEFENNYELLPISDSGLHSGVLLHLRGWLGMYVTKAVKSLVGLRSDYETDFGMRFRIFVFPQ